jgi:hypothetical protein
MGANMYSLQISKHTSTKWLTVASPYIPDTAVPARHLGFVQVKIQNLSLLAKRLRGWVSAYSLVGNEVIQESRKRSKNPLNMQVTEDGDLRNF